MRTQHFPYSKQSGDVPEPQSHAPNRAANKADRDFHVQEYSQSVQLVELCGSRTEGSINPGNMLFMGCTLATGFALEEAAVFPLIAGDR